MIRYTAEMHEKNVQKDLVTEWAQANLNDWSTVSWIETVDSLPTTLTVCRFHVHGATPGQFHYKEKCPSIPSQRVAAPGLCRFVRTVMVSEPFPIDAITTVIHLSNPALPTGGKQ